MIFSDLFFLADLLGVITNTSLFFSDYYYTGSRINKFLVTTNDFI